MEDIKQVIVIRKDLKMRRGKEIVQGAHASMAFIVKKVVQKRPFSDVERAWMEGIFTKVCVRVNSEEELLSVAKEGEDGGLRVEVITDVGKTEFDGVPTKTCMALGPDLASKIDAVTRRLQLY